MEHEVWYKYPEAVCHLADDVFFISAQELEDMYPDLTIKQREDAIVTSSRTKNASLSRRSDIR